MKQLIVAAAIVSLAATGCVTTSQFARNSKKCGPACHVARSQSAPRPEIIRTACHEGILGGMMGKNKNSCDPGCGYGDCCCECTCGCPDECCCECTCGCPEDCCYECTCGCPDECCCDPGCGCEDPCCGDCCDNRSCLQKLVDRIASGGCGKAPGGRGSGGVLGGCGCGQSGCSHCGAGGNGCVLCPHAGGYPAMTNFNPGPPVGQTAYPYYTTRGPRDFLQNNPPNIGPY